jgi:hypothetical protein
MSFSTLVDIVELLAGLVVQFDGNAVPVQRLTTQPNWADAAELPVRIIPALGGVRLVEGGVYTPTRSMRAVWEIDDLLLVRDVGMGRGVADTATALVDYIEDYVAQLRFAWLARGDVQLLNVSGIVDVVRYGERAYEGVVMTTRFAHLIRAPSA